MNSDIEELYSFCGRLGLLQVHDCKGDGGGVGVALGADYGLEFYGGTCSEL